MWNEPGINCETCHGPAGSPDPDSPVVQALGVVPADLSDPLFNSREPAGDWEMVVMHGGDAMGLATQMPPHRDALSDEQVRSVVTYVKSMVDTSAYPPGEMNLFLPIRTKKAPWAVPAACPAAASRCPERRRALFFEGMGGSGVESVYPAIGAPVGKLVLEFVHEKDALRNELTEIEAGYKRALSWSGQYVLSGAIVVAKPVDSADGDGELQGYLAYGTALSPRWILQSSLRLKFPFESASDGAAELAGIVHYVHSPWARRVFPALEVVAERPFRSSNGDLEWTALPQVRIGLTKGGHVALNLGVELPLSDQSWDERYYVTLLWDFADGGFFKGW